MWGVSASVQTLRYCRFVWPAHESLDVAQHVIERNTRTFELVSLYIEIWVYFTVVAVYLQFIPNHDSILDRHQRLSS